MYRPPSGPPQNALKQYRCRVQFDKAWALFSERQRAVIAGCVLQNYSIKYSAELLGVKPLLLGQQLCEALDLLVKHLDIKGRIASGRLAA
jgi:hypothetical protein